MADKHLDLLKKDLRIETLRKVKNILMSVLAWLSVMNMFLFVPLAFFNIVPFGLVFANSIIIFFITVGTVVLINVVKKMMISSILETMNLLDIKDCDPNIPEDLKTKMREKFLESIKEEKNDNEDK